MQSWAKFSVIFCYCTLLLEPEIWTDILVKNLNIVDFVLVWKKGHELDEVPHLLVSSKKKKKKPNKTAV